jgi:hypothetical protein
VPVPAHAVILMQGCGRAARGSARRWHRGLAGITDARRGTLLSLGAIELRKHPNADAAD